MEKASSLSSFRVCYHVVESARHGGFDEFWDQLKFLVSRLIRSL